MTIDVIIPTCNPNEELLTTLLESLQRQSRKPNKVFLLNTVTANCNVELFNAKYKIADNIEIRHLESTSFDHATTRNKAAKLSDADFITFFTQDAVPADNMLLENLSKRLNENVIIAFGRQTAQKENKIEYLSRSFNYPLQSYIKSEKDKARMGIKVIFCSNVCAMYNRKTFWELGGFKDHNIFNEDMLFAYKAIKAGYSIAYEAEACVKHTHHYTCKSVFNRFFDQGVSQKENEKIFKEFSSLGEGKKQAKYIIGNLWKEKAFCCIGAFVAQSFAKVFGFFLGKHYNLLPRPVCKALSLNKNYWKKTVND